MTKYETFYSHTDVPDLVDATEETIESTVEEPVVEKTIEGNVVKCEKLNVREEPVSDANIICELKKDSIVLIDMDNSTDTFYKVTTVSGIEGYCVKEYINVM